MGTAPVLKEPKSRSRLWLMFQCIRRSKNVHLVVCETRLDFDNHELPQNTMTTIEQDK